MEEKTPVEDKKGIRWRRVIITYVLGGMICVALYVGGRAYLAQSAKGTTVQVSRSQMSVPANQHNFGRVTSGQTLRHEFQVENRGTSRLVLNRKVCGSCGDDDAPRQIIIEPGEKTQIAVTLDTRGKVGPIQRVVKYTTSDRNRPSFRFVMTAFIVAGN